MFDRSRITSILVFSLLAFLFFGVFTLVICFSVGGLETGLGDVISETGGTSVDVPIPSYMLTFVEAYLWVGMSTSATNPFLIVLAQALPPTYIFYISTALAGFLAGLLLFKRNPDRIKNSVIAPLLTALYVIVAVVIMSSIIISAISSALTQAAGGFGSLGGMMMAMLGPIISEIFGIGATGYVLIFIITYAMLTIGALLAALLWRSKAGQTAAAPAPSQAPEPASTEEDDVTTGLDLGPMLKERTPDKKPPVKK